MRRILPFSAVMLAVAPVAGQDAARQEPTAAGAAAFAPLLVSSGIAALGTALLWTGDFDALFESPSRQVVLFTVLIAQLISSIIIERRTSRGAP